jgi:WD40 repeat protein
LGAQVLPDGRVLSWSWDGTLRLWDGQSGAPLAVMEGHTRWVKGAQVLPDGRLLSSSEDGTLRLWDGETGAPLAVMLGHTGGVNGAELLPDGRVLSCSDDHTLRLWDSQSGTPLAVVPEPWVWHQDLPVSWAESAEARAGAKRAGNTWYQQTDTLIAFADQVGAWRALRHGPSSGRIHPVRSGFVAISARHVMFLQLMRGAQRLREDEGSARSASISESTT